jgi:peroxiredoxin Q/BCP
MEAAGFRDLKPQFDALGVTLLGVSRDSLKSHEKFSRDQGLTFTLLSDPDAAMMTAYGAFGEKVLYGKTTIGTIRSTVVVAGDGTVLRHWPKVAKAETHPAEVLAFLQSL